MLVWLLRIWLQLPGPLKLLYLQLRYGRFAVGLAALIRDERGRVLLVHRTYSREEPWALPGGWLERRDPDIPTALERELREETGLRVRIGACRAVERTGFAVVMLIDAELLDPIARFRSSPEISDIAWVELGDVSHLSRVNARLLRQVMS
jgi:ADP-ribose pyrophosphatase YjhB (NUDIX family)